MLPLSQKGRKQEFPPRTAKGVGMGTKNNSPEDGDKDTGEVGSTGSRALGDGS